jgi:hypothetical protein
MQKYKRKQKYIWTHEGPRTKEKIGTHECPKVLKKRKMNT